MAASIAAATSFSLAPSRDAPMAACIAVVTIFAPARR